MIDPSVANLSPGLAISISVLSLAVVWLIYDRLCKTALVENNARFFWVMFIGLTLLAYLFTELFSARAAYIQMGAIIGTLMVANVFFVHHSIATQDGGRHEARRGAGSGDRQSRFSTLFPQ